MFDIGDTVTTTISKESLRSMPFRRDKEHGTVTRTVTGLKKICVGYEVRHQDGSCATYSPFELLWEPKPPKKNRTRKRTQTPIFQTATISRNAPIPTRSSRAIRVEGDMLYEVSQDEAVPPTEAAELIQEGWQRCVADAATP
jgi:hypothetical protein